MKANLSKRLLALFTAVIMMLTSIPAIAADIPEGTIRDRISITQELRIVYECEFEAEIDDSFAETWLYGYRDEETGKIKFKFQKVSNLPEHDFILTINDKIKYANDTTFASGFTKGEYTFTWYRGRIMNDEIRNYYVTSQPRKRMLHISMSRQNGESIIKLWMHKNSADSGGYVPITNIITADSFEENPDYAAKARYAFGGSFNDSNIEANEENSLDNSDVDEEEQESLDEQENSSDEKSDNAENEEEPVEEDDVSSPGKEETEKSETSSAEDDKWADKEKTIELYSQYRDDDGNIRSVTFLKGVHSGKRYDYEVNSTANFVVDMPEFGVSSDGMTNITFYGIHLIINGKTYPAMSLLRAQGDKGERWFAEVTHEVRRPPNEINEASKLTNDYSIYMGFKPIYNFDGYTYDDKFIDDINLNFTLVYTDESKTVVDHVDISYEGNREEVEISDINYTGIFLIRFLRMMYPDTYEELAKELGLSL